LCEALVDSAPLPMLIASPTGELLFGNPALAQLLGMRSDELHGKLNNTLLGKWCPRIERDVRQVLSRQKALRLPLTIENSRGESRGGWLTLAPYKRGGEIVGVCGVIALLGEVSEE
jgi:PAS domain S-box-containing protein